MKKQRGVTLIEQMITLLVSMIAILGVTKYQLTMMTTEAQTKQRAEALSITQNQIETLRFNGYKEVLTSGEANVNGNTATYRVTWEVKPNTDWQYDDLVVTTTWNHKTESNNVDLDSLVANTYLADSGRLMLGQLTTGHVNIDAGGTSGGGNSSSGTGGTTGGTGGDSNNTSGNNTSGGTSASTSYSCDCVKSKQGNNITFALAANQPAACAVAQCQAAATQCSGKGNYTCTFTVTGS